MQRHTVGFVWARTVEVVIALEGRCGGLVCAGVGLGPNARGAFQIAGQAKVRPEIFECIDCEINPVPDLVRYASDHLAGAEQGAVPAGEAVPT